MPLEALIVPTVETLPIGSSGIKRVTGIQHKLQREDMSHEKVKEDGLPCFLRFPFTYVLNVHKMATES